MIEKLFEPTTLGNLTLKNRVVMAPMTRNFSPAGVPKANVVNYYKVRASVGLIITEGTTINHPSANGYKDVPHFYGEAALAGWRQVVEAVHTAGGKIFPQLWHVGSIRRLGMEPDPSVPAYGPMGKEKGGKVLVKAMTKKDIKDITAAYVEAAIVAKDIGFDGIEVHSAHGYLLDQFLFEGTNQREDEYGGSLEKRARFAREVIEAIRQEVGPDFPICLRYSQWKMADFDANLAHTPEMLEKLLKIFTSAGVDIFHASTRRFWEPAFEGSDLTLAGWTKKLSGKPTIAVGSVGLDEDFISTFNPSSEGAASTSLEKLDTNLERGEFDLIAIGRGLIANPDWVNKVKEGRLSDLAPYTKELLSNLD